MQSLQADQSLYNYSHFGNNGERKFTTFFRNQL